MRISIRLLFVAIALWPAVGGAAPRVGMQNRSTEKRPAIIVISVDGLASFYFDDPKAEMRISGRLRRTCGCLQFLLRPRSEPIDLIWTCGSSSQLSWTRGGEGHPGE
jgi:hypothetical protein